MNSMELPNRFDFAEAGERIYQFWESAGLFHADPDPDKLPFTIVIPPPNVTGALHLGHALNNTLQDIQIRRRRMQGYVALWMPGTDHAGIATQAVVERRLKEEEGKTRHDLGRDALVERIWAWKTQYEARILGQLKRMGCSCDWRRTRFTLDDICARAVRHTFFDLFHKQRIFRGKRLVNWDTFLQTAVSDDEVYTEKTAGNLWHLKYPVVDPQPGEPAHVVVATTRPETMLGDTAVAVHPQPDRALEKVEQELAARWEQASAKERPALAEQRRQVAERRSGMLAELEQLAEMARQGRHVLLPLLHREIPLVADLWAKPEMGSGCVKITPAHDPNDYLVGQRQQLPIINILNPDGTLNDQAGPYGGLTIGQARKRVLEDLDVQGLVDKIEPHEIELPLSDRSKTPIEPYLADQWFVKMDELAQSAMDAVTDGRVKIVPQRYGKSYLDWLGEKRDWPVSRQLWWGHQIPVWSRRFITARERDAMLKKLQESSELASARVAFQSEQPADSGTSPDHAAPSTGSSAEPCAGSCLLHVCLQDDEAGAGYLESEGFQREEDVLDTWFSSALWPHSTLGWPEKNPDLDYFYPTSVLITSRDIITLWVARMVLTGLNNLGEVPFREVYIHPKILDGDGETMSKSKGNGIDPLDVIERFGPDALRFGMAHLTTETQDVRMPVDFECPHCQALVHQTRENRVKTRLKCPKCGESFSTQWAEKPEDVALPRAAVVSERFEQSRNFCNKLWNASRFALMNLAEYSAEPIMESQLTIEDHWILSRLATVTGEVAAALDAYQYADATRSLYSFAWDEFCSFYVEMLKDRLQDPQQRPVAQRVLAHALDTLLRLLHPFVPFITEEVWQQLNKAAPRRGLIPAVASDSIMVAAWPDVEANRINPEIESRFALFQSTLGALREIRSRQNIPPRSEVEFWVRCDSTAAQLLEPLSPYFARMAQATASGYGDQVSPSGPTATVLLPGMEVIVNLRGFLDVEAEQARLDKQEAGLRKQIEGKEKKLGNASFLERAPADVVEREREALEQLRGQRESILAARAELQRLA
jgi:valyl-tRNA synthetase